MTKRLIGTQKETSLKDHKGVGGFKGSGYNGKGKADSSKVRSNKGREKK